MLAIKCDKPGKIKLRDIPTNSDGGLKREESPTRFAALATQLAELQELCYAAGTQSLLIVVQGMDTAGKDGTLKSIAGAMNPVGIRVASFKVPTAFEAGHDFLWRVHQQTPVRGETVFFNRSHYEDVLVVRVHNLVLETQWQERYGHINDFEELLAESGTIVLKFFLHISKEEQERRLLSREENLAKGWKLNVGDWKEREFWDDYQQAYDDAIEKCAAKDAPWFIIPADKKWFRDSAVAEAIVETLKPHRQKWEQILAGIGETRKAELAAYRKGGS
jgi:PPK2 family polyphosphate:nucleotide phosphotransferase